MLYRHQLGGISRSAYGRALDQGGTTGFQKRQERPAMTSCRDSHLTRARAVGWSDSGLLPIPFSLKFLIRPTFLTPNNFHGPVMATDDTHVEEKPGWIRWSWSLGKYYARKTWLQYRKLPLRGKVCSKTSSRNLLRQCIIGPVMGSASCFPG